MIWPVFATAAVSFLMLAAVYVPLERLFPARKGQAVFRPAWLTDALFFAGQYLLFGAAVLFVLTWLQDGLEALLPGGWFAAVRSQPLPVQVIEVVLLSDLTVYWGHRLSHQNAFLWRFHSVHHTAEHLDWLAAHREHPVDGLFTQLCVNLGPVLLGFPIELLAGFVTFRGLWAIFIHSNVKLPLGPLKYLFGAPELHHWHHAKGDQMRHNYANLAPYMDLLFGTYHCPEGEERYPLGIDQPHPKGYFAQLLYAFRPPGRQRGYESSAPSDERSENDRSFSTLSTPSVRSNPSA